MRLTWIDRGQYVESAVICDSFVLRLEHDCQSDLYRVAIIERWRLAPLYQSKRVFLLEDAKMEAVRAALRVARRRARLYTGIADTLKRVASFSEASA